LRTGGAVDVKGEHQVTSRW